jgi:hypothetical protein
MKLVWLGVLKTSSPSTLHCCLAKTSEMGCPVWGGPIS